MTTRYLWTPLELLQRKNELSREDNEKKQQLFREQSKTLYKDKKVSLGQAGKELPF